MWRFDWVWLDYEEYTRLKQLYLQISHGTTGTCDKGYVELIQEEQKWRNKEKSIEGMLKSQYNQSWLNEKDSIEWFEG